MNGLCTVEPVYGYVKLFGWRVNSGLFKVVGPKGASFSGPLQRPAAMLIAAAINNFYIIRDDVDCDPKKIAGMFIDDVEALER